MQIPIDEIVNGSRDGQIVWVCDYRRPDLGNKPIRIVSPTRVIVCENDPEARIYYSRSHFKKLNAKDEPIKSKIIKPFDNTGYRSYTGEPVAVFDNRDECVEHWKMLVKDVVIRLEDYKICIVKRAEREIEELSKYLK